jgi:hypothetical protein
MTDTAGRARLCGCEHPLLDDGSCLRCGRSVTFAAEPVPDEPRQRVNVDWTRPKVVRALKAFAFFRGRAPLSDDWQKRTPEDWPALETVVSMFGSLEAASRAAGLEPPSSRAAG